MITIQNTLIRNYKKIKDSFKIPTKTPNYMAVKHHYFTLVVCPEYLNYWLARNNTEIQKSFLRKYSNVNQM